MSRSKRVLEALGASYFSFAIRVTIKFLVTPFFLTYLGPELMGFRSFIMRLLNYVLLTGFGVKSAIIAIVSKELQPGSSKEKKDSVIRILRAGGQFQLVIALLILLFSFVLATSLGSFSQGLSEENLDVSRWCTILFGLCISISIVSGVYSGTLTGLQLIAQNQLFNLAGALLAAAIGVLLVYFGGSLYGVAIAWIVSATFVFLTLRWRIAKLGISLRLFRPPIERRAMPKLFKLSGWIFLASVGGDVKQP